MRGLFPLIMLSLCLAGCPSHVIQSPRPTINAVSQAITDDANAIGDAAKEGRIKTASADAPILETYWQRIFATTDDLKRQPARLLEAEKDVVKLETALNDANGKITKLENSTSKKLGDFIIRAAWIIGAGWLVVGVASAWLGSGTGLVATIATQIVHALPLANGFVWLLGWLTKSKTT